MPPRAAILLLITAACPIMASVVVLSVLPSRAAIFSNFTSPAFVTQLYFVTPALFAALTSIALRRLVAQRVPENLLAIGAIGFAAFGISDGLNSSDASLAFATRAGLGASMAFLMTGFNRIAMQRWERATSIWLLTYLNLATNAYGVAAALLAEELAHSSSFAPFLLFGFPALSVVAYFSLASNARPLAATKASEGTKSPISDSPPPAIHTAVIVVGHMAIHVLIYFHIANIEIKLVNHALGGGERTSLYVFGHFLGAILFKPVSRVFESYSTHLMAALFFCLICTIALASYGETGGLGAALLLVLSGVMLSHVLPLVFAYIRDAVPHQRQGRWIAEAVAAGFIGQFAAPFILSGLRISFGSSVSPSFAAAIISAGLAPSAIAVFLAKHKHTSSI